MLPSYRGGGGDPPTSISDLRDGGIAEEKAAWRPSSFSLFRHLLTVTLAAVIAAGSASVISQSLPAHLTCVIISALRNAPSSPTALADGLEKGHTGGGGGGGGDPGPGHHVAQEMAALCSLAFIRSAAMLEDLRSGSTLRS